MRRTLEKNSCLKAPGLAISAGGAKIAKYANTILGVIGQKLYSKTTADCPAMTGINLVDGYKRIVAVCMATDSSTVSYVSSTPVLNATVLDLGDFPMGAHDKLTIGWIIIESTGAVFTGGTTALDAGTVTATYIDNFGV